MPIHPKPGSFTADGAPAGVEVKFVTFYAQRPVMKAPPRLQLVHTNAASGTGTIASAWNWAHAKPNSNTLPHYQIDRDGSARKMLPTNRVGIANSTVDAYQGSHGDVRNFSLAYETADDGYGPGRLGDESGFTPAQAETLAGVLAYESITHGIPLDKPTEWYGAGTGGHTSPFAYPFWTMYRGKTCPGRKKLEQLWNEVLPRARAIKNAWTQRPLPNPLPDTGDEDDVKHYLVLDPRDGGTQWVSDLATFKTPISHQDVAADGVRCFGWVPGATADDPYRPWVLGPWWSDYIARLPVVAG